MSIQEYSYWVNRPLKDEKRDWAYDADNWVEDYVDSINHPHRSYIIKELKTLSKKYGEFKSVYEIGCNTGPNLELILENFNVEVGGIDASRLAIQGAKEVLPTGSILKVGNMIRDIPDRDYDVLISDACLMYVNPDELDSYLKKILPHIKKYLIFIEWGTYNLRGIVKDYHYAHNFPRILHSLGWMGREGKKITKEIWPTKTWMANGRIYTYHRPLKTLKKSSLRKQN